MIRKAKAVWRGTGRTGNGNLSTDSGVLAETPYSFSERVSRNEKGTFQSRRVARLRAHAGCFTMWLYWSGCKASAIGPLGGLEYLDFPGRRSVE